MKTLIYIAIALAVSTIKMQAQATSSLKVTVESVLNSKGSLLFVLYDAETFMKTDPIKSQDVKIEGQTVIASFTDIPNGEYAVVVIHDENANKRMDFQPNGMPAESYGTSSKTMTFGPPSWEESKLIVSEDTAITIRL